MVGSFWEGVGGTGTLTRTGPEFLYRSLPKLNWVLLLPIWVLQKLDWVLQLFDWVLQLPIWVIQLPILVLQLPILVLQVPTWIMSLSWSFYLLNKGNLVIMTVSHCLKFSFFLHYFMMKMVVSSFGVYSIDRFELSNHCLSYWKLFWQIGCWDRTCNVSKETMRKKTVRATNGLSVVKIFLVLPP